MSDNQPYPPGALVLVRDQYQPLNPIPAVIDRYADGDPLGPHRLVKVTYRESGTAHWIDASRIIGLDERARREPEERDPNVG